MDPRPFFLALLAVFAFAACSSDEGEVETAKQEEATPEPASYAPATVGSFKNAMQFGGWTFGGQPSADDLAALKAAGVTRVIDLRMPDEDHGFDEPAVCAELGLAYESVPFTPKEPDSESGARALALFQAGPEGGTFVHCASGNRVALLFTVHRVKHEGADLEAALDEAQKAGLSESSVAVVRTLVGE